MPEEKLRIIPFYTGDATLKEVIGNKKSLNMLWLEILLNDHISWENYLHIPEIRMAYDKAWIWYCNFKTVVDTAVGERHLRELEGKIDEREYRRFLEVLNFDTD